MAKSRLPISCPTASFDGLFYGRYPHGDAPQPSQPIAGAAADTTSANAALTGPPSAFDFFITPNGDDNNNGLTPGTGWSLSALNSKQATYAGKNIGIVGDVAGVQTPITQTSIGGVTKTLYATAQAQPGNFSGCIFNINGGTSIASTYVASCDSSGVYKARWAVIDFSLPGSGGATVPTVASAFLGQNFNLGSVPNGGFLTIDGLVMKYFTQAMLVCSNVAGTLLNFVCKNCEISNGGNVPSNQNPAAIYLSGCMAPVITNNKIHDLQTITGGATAPWGMCALATFPGSSSAAPAMVVTHNTFYNCISILTKNGHQTFADCSYNYLDHGAFGSANNGTDLAQGALTGHSPGPGQTSFIHHNIFLGALNLHAQTSTANIAGTVQAFNNTIYGSPSYTAAFNAVEADVAVSGAALQFENNLVYAVNGYDHGAAFGTCMWITANIAVAPATFDKNVYGSNSNGISISRNGFVSSPLATWQAATSCDPNSVLVSTTPFSGTPTAQVPSSFAVNASAVIGGVTCGALDGSGPVGCNF